MKSGPNWAPSWLALKWDFDLRLSLLASPDQPIDVAWSDSVMGITGSSNFAVRR
jgi:hypothetical protein